ncbi:EAL domain-containing protein [Caballeronia mineralivorans]|uniref:EAL domain-containing protein n=1 Tax=Caballeronia mineralivorans TaxID=2010198 RepID=UPI002B002C6B|nr:EAL domain-containing protein [Caballeronia mineralivorans]
MIDWKLRSSGMGFMGREFETANSRQFNMDMIPKTANSYGIVGDMERGLTRGEFLFVYQPRLRSGETKISGFDVLMRWRHPVDGLLEPSAFISVVDNSRLAGNFTDLLLAHAIDMLSAWKAKGHDRLTLAVHLSVPELSRLDLPAKLRALLIERQLPADRLQIELTDVVEPAKLDFLEDAINAVRATGVKVALDNFGAGFTSLTLLHQLSVDILKIDGSLLRNVPQHAESRCILETLVRLGQRMGKQLVLQGIETEYQYRWARTLPGIECQGYYISKPISLAGVDELLASSAGEFLDAGGSVPPSSTDPL